MHPHQLQEPPRQGRTDLERSLFSTPTKSDFTQRVQQSKTRFAGVGNARALATSRYHTLNTLFAFADGEYETLVPRLMFFVNETTEAYQVAFQLFGNPGERSQLELTTVPRLLSHKDKLPTLVNRGHDKILAGLDGGRSFWFHPIESAKVRFEFVPVDNTKEEVPAAFLAECVLFNKLAYKQIGPQPLYTPQLGDDGYGRGDKVGVMYMEPFGDAILWSNVPAENRGARILQVLLDISETKNMLWLGCRADKIRCDVADPSKALVCIDAYPYSWLRFYEPVPVLGHIQILLMLHTTEVRTDKRLWTKSLVQHLVDSTKQHGGLYRVCHRIAELDMHLSKMLSVPPGPVFEIIERKMIPFALETLTDEHTQWLDTKEQTEQPDKPLPREEKIIDASSVAASSSSPSVWAHQPSQDMDEFITPPYDVFGDAKTEYMRTTGIVLDPRTNLTTFLTKLNSPTDSDNTWFATMRDDVNAFQVRVRLLVRVHWTVFHVYAKLHGVDPNMYYTLE